MAITILHIIETFAVVACATCVAATYMIYKLIPRLIEWENHEETRKNNK